MHCSIEDLKLINGVNFTEREVDIIACLIGGKAYKKIATLLDISSKTVEMHTRNIMLKLGCNSRDNIIDFIEKSNKFAVIKQYYSNLLIKEVFTKELKKIAKLTQNKVNCLIWYDKAKKTKNLFVSNLEKNLAHAGIKTITESWSSNNFVNSLQLSLVNKPVNYVMCVVNNELLAKLDINTYRDEIFSLLNKLQKGTDFIFYLVLEHNIAWQEKLAEFTCLDFATQEQYYLSNFELLKQLLPSVNIQESITAFKKQTIALDGNTTLQKWFLRNEESNAIIPSIPRPKSRKKVSWKWLILIISPLSFSFVVYHINKEINFLTKKSQSIELKLAKYSKHILLNASEKIKPFNQAPLNNQVTNSTNLITDPLKCWPLQLPFHDNKLFIERNLNHINYMEILHKNLKQTPNQLNTLVLHGLGGVGKTQLVTHYIHSQAARQDYKLMVWFAAENKESLERNYLEFAKALGLLKSYYGSMEDVKNLVLNWFTNNPNWLIVFDNVRDYASIKPYLPQEGGSILITSRQAIWPASIKTINIMPMSKEEAIKLVQVFSGQDSAENLTLVRKLGYLPLAIAQAASYMKVYDKTAQEYIKLYNQSQQELLNKDLRSYGVEHEPVMVTWNNSLKSLEEETSENKENILAKDFLIMCAYLAPEQIPKTILTKWIEITTGKKNVELTADTIMAKLFSRSLVNKEENGKSLNMHRLLQATIRKQNKHMHTEQAHLTNILETLVRLFTKDARYVHSFQDQYNLLPHVNMVIKHLKNYLTDPHNKLQVARLLSVKAYFHTQTGMAVIQNATALTKLAQQFYEEIAGITPTESMLWLEGGATLEERTRKCADLLYYKLSHARLPESERKLLPILYAANLYIAGRMHFFQQNETHESLLAALYLSKHISELIEKNTGQKIFYKILAARDGILCFNNVNTNDTKALGKTLQSYEELLADVATYTNEDQQFQRLKTDTYHKLVCYRRILQIYTQLMQHRPTLSYYQQASKYIKKITKLVAAKTDLERMANHYNTIGNFYLASAKYKKAIPYFVKARDIEEAKNRGQGKLDYPLADAYYGLTKAYMNIHSYHEAKESINQCLRIREMLYRSDDLLLIATRQTQQSIAKAKLK